MEAFWISFGIVFVAELGDKSQLMALAFAARYRIMPVLVGISVATAVAHALSVGIGAAFSAALPIRVITVAAGAAFLGFGFWTLRGDSLSEDEGARAAQVTRSVVMAVGVAFFLAELGDKTMLATVTLASTEGLWGTWLGSTIGMVAADGLAIGVGAALGSRLSSTVVRLGAAVLFFIFGILLISDGAF